MCVPPPLVGFCCAISLSPSLPIVNTRTCLSHAQVATHSTPSYVWGDFIWKVGRRRHDGMVGRGGDRQEYDVLESKRKILFIQGACPWPRDYKHLLPEGYRVHQYAMSSGWRGRHAKTSPFNLGVEAILRSSGGEDDIIESTESRQGEVAASLLRHPTPQRSAPCPYPCYPCSRQGRTPRYLHQRGRRSYSLSREIGVPVSITRYKG